MISDNLNCSQIRALYKYINDGYVIINSGRSSGKTQTLVSIIKYWVKYQVKNNDICVMVIGNMQFVGEFKNKMVNDLRTDDDIEKILVTPSEIKILHINGICCYISICTNIKQYFNNKYNGKYAGTNVSLLVGDECYIDPEWCKYTACAYTQYYSIATLGYNSDVRSDILKLKNVMNKKDFDREYGQYL